MEKIFNKANAIIMVLLLPLIAIGEYVLETAHLATWPAFMVMVFFFMAHMNIKEGPAILIGGAFGLVNITLIKYWYAGTVSFFGGDLAKFTDPKTVEAMFYSKLIYIGIFVCLIVLLREVLPWIFNNYAFMMFIVAAVASGGNTAAAIAAKTVAGTAAAAAAGADPAAIAAMKAATDKAVAATVPISNVNQWIGTELIGGACFIAGIYGIVKVLGMLAGAPASANEDIKG